MNRIIPILIVLIPTLFSCKPDTNKIVCDNSVPNTVPFDISPNFEIAASVYAWELHDEGVKNVLDNLQTISAVNSVYLVGLMHPEPRPHGGDYFVHNPIRSKWFPEDSRAYWIPDLNLYSEIYPQQSGEEWLNETDWLNTLIDEAKLRKLKVGVEVSHSILNTRTLLQNPEMIQLDIFGNPAKMVWNNYWPCPNNPKFQKYTVQIFQDLAKNYDLDYIQTCMLLFVWGNIHNAGCFCNFCINKMEAEGIATKELIENLKINPDAEPYKSTWISFRKKCAAEVYQRIYSGIREVNDSVEFRLNHHTKNNGVWKDGLLTEILPYINSIRLSDYAEQKESKTLELEKLKWIQEVRSETKNSKPIIVGIGIRPNANKGSIINGIKNAVSEGAAGISLGHYDGACFSSLRAIRQGLTECGINKILAHYTVEAEEMSFNTDGNQRINHKMEKSIFTSSNILAQQVLDVPTGNYALLVTYFDDDNGQAVCSLGVNGQNIDKWKFNEECKCWKVKVISPTLIHHRDTLQLNCQRDGNDWGQIDAIEFIPLK